MAKKLPSGTWRQRVTWTDERGMRKSVSFTADTEAEADFRAAEFKFKHKREGKPENMTVSQAVERYIENKSAVLSPTTITGYEKDKRINISIIGNTPLKSLSNSIIQRWINDLSRRLKRKTVANALGLLTAALSVYLPEFKVNVTLAQKEKSPVVIPQKSEIEMLLNASEGTPLHMAIMLGALCGMRRSEIAALKWSDIDFKKKTVHIQRAAVINTDKKLVEKLPKTIEGDRVLDIPDRLMLELVELRDKQDRPCTAALSTITSDFPRLCEKCGLPKYNFHLLRRYFASVLLSLNIPFKYAMELMGHATEDMLKKVYGHVMKEKNDEVRLSVLQYFNQ